MGQLLELLGEFNVLSIIFRLGLSMLLGAIIGADRSKKGSPAGLKTHALVSIGSTLVMLTSEYCMIKFQSGDVTRMSAQVISGIGFLGAGTILITGRDQIKGLTSAAGIWFSACVGLSVGIGFYVGALVAMMFEFVVFKLLSKSKFQVSEKSTMDLYIEYNDHFNLQKLLMVMKRLEGELLQVDSERFLIFKNNEHFHNAVFTLQLPFDVTYDQVMIEMESLHGIVEVEDIT